MEIVEIPLADLSVSRHNTRRAEADPDGMRQLKASILSHGLLSPPLVAASKNGGYDVIGGSRRLEALCALVREGWLPSDFSVSCVLAPEVAESLLSPVEISLAENSAREKLHPVDQAAACQRLYEAGVRIADVAKRFGLSETTVRRRLQLGRVSPELLDDCRAGKLSLKEVEAVSAEPDHDRQHRIVRRTGKVQWGRDWRIREAAQGKRPKASTIVAQFVGLGRYRDAGGTVSTDLFGQRTEDGEPALSAMWLDDPQLLERLALERLEEAAQAEREKGWTDVRTGLELPDAHWTLESLNHVGRPGDAPGAWVHLVPGNGGVNRWVFRDPASTPAADAGEDSADAQEDPVPVPAHAVNRGLERNLAVMRRSIERERLSRDPELALDVLLFWLSSQLHFDPIFWTTLTGFPTGRASDDIGEKDLPPCVVEADAALAERETHAVGMLGLGDDAERWTALRDMTAEDKRTLLACCVARMLKTRAVGTAPDADAALGELGIDWAAAFDPGREVLARLTKPHLLEIAADSLDPVLDCDATDLSHLGGMKKGKLVDAVSEAFARHREREGRSPWTPWDEGSGGDDD